MILSYQDYKVGWICALQLELTAAIAMLDEYHEPLERARGDDNTYVLGRLGKHNVAVACLPIGEIGTNSAAQVASHMLRTFPSIKIGLLVGIGGGVPSSKHDIRLGDIVVSKPSDQNGGVFQYDLGRNMPESFQNFGFLNAPPRVLRSAITTLEAWNEIPDHELKLPDYLAPSKNPKLPPHYTYPHLEHDELFKPEYHHVDDKKTCADCDRANLVPRSPRDTHEPVVHYGIIASGNQVMKNAIVRNQLATQYDVLCFEMEAAGLMNAFPCVVIRGICDYADSHKNKVWQPYAAATAAAYAKVLLGFVPPEQLAETSAIVLPTSIVRSVTSTEAPQTATTATSTASDQVTGDSATYHSHSMPILTPFQPSSFFIFSQILLPSNSVALGRLVIDTSAPWEDFCPHPLNITSEDVVIKSQVRMQEIFERTKLSKTHDKLNKYLSSLLGSSLESLNSVPATTYILLNSGNWFKELCKEPRTRKWLNDTIKYGWNVHMVVGISTVKKRSIGGESSERNPQGLGLDTANVTSTSTAGGATLTFIPKDQLIFAVQFRRVRFKWFSSRKVDAAFLEMESNRWKLPLISRRGDVSDSEDDLVEAYLQEALAEDDITSQGEYSFADDESV
jgi:nucleoside phosphorylase